MDVEVRQDVHSCFKGTHRHSLSLICKSATEFSGEGGDLTGGQWGILASRKGK